MKFGFPGLDTVRSFDDYVLSYDRRNRVPHWVFEHLTKETLVYNENIDRSKCEFTEDTSMHPYFRYR
jgi:endonuclease G